MQLLPKYNWEHGFSSRHIWMWELHYKESWVPKNWCFWNVVLEKTPESPLDTKEIQPVPLATWCKELTHWKIPWCWERLKAGGERDDSSILAWRIPWTEESGELQSMGLQRLRLDWSDCACTELIHCLLPRCLPCSPSCLLCFLAPRPEWSSHTGCHMRESRCQGNICPGCYPGHLGVSLPTSLFSFHCHIVCLFPPKCRQAQIQNIVDELSSTVPRTRMEENRFLF